MVLTGTTIAARRQASLSVWKPAGVAPGLVQPALPVRSSGSFEQPASMQAATSAPIP